MTLIDRELQSGNPDYDFLDKLLDRVEDAFKRLQEARRHRYECELQCVEIEQEIKLLQVRIAIAERREKGLNAT